MWQQFCERHTQKRRGTLLKEVLSEEEVQYRRLRVCRFIIARSFWKRGALGPQKVSECLEPERRAVGRSAGGNASDCRNTTCEKGNVQLITWRLRTESCVGFDSAGTGFGEFPLKLIALFFKKLSL